MAQKDINRKADAYIAGGFKAMQEAGQEKTAHTPGPWSANYDGQILCESLNQYGNWIVAIIGREMTPEDHANAALIAAAPEIARKLAEAEARIAELEEALQNLRRAAVWMYGELQPNFPLREKCAATIRAAESLLPRGEEWGSDEKTEQEGTGIIEGLQDALLSEYMRPCDERP